MIVDHFHIIGVSVLEAEDDAPSVRDRDGVSTLAVAGQSTDPIVGRSQVRRRIAALQALQYLFDLGSQFGRQVSLVTLGELLVAR